MSVTMVEIIADTCSETWKGVSLDPLASPSVSTADFRDAVSIVPNRRTTSRTAPAATKARMTCQALSRTSPSSTKARVSALTGSHTA